MRSPVVEETLNMCPPSDEECLRRLRAVSEAALAITSELTLEQVLQKIVDVARELVQARYAAVGVIGEERLRLASFVTSGLTHEEIEAIGPWPRGLGLLGLLLNEPRSVRVKNISKDSRSVGFPPNHPTMTSFLGVPIVSKGNVLGNFYMTDKIGKEEFSQQDEDTLAMFAAHAAVAIENARLYTDTSSELRQKIAKLERAERQARFLAELGSLFLAAPFREELWLQDLAKRLTEPFGDASGVYLVDENDPTVLRKGVMFHANSARKKVAEDVVRAAWGWLRELVVSYKQAILVPLTGTEEYWTGDSTQAEKDHHRFGGILAVPIVVGEKTYGLLVSLTSQPFNLTQDDLRFASLVADRLATAIDNIRLYRELCSQRSLLESILDTMSEAVYVADPQSNLLSVNRAFAQTIGANSKEEVVGSIAKYTHLVNPRREDGRAMPDEELPMERALKGETFNNAVMVITPLAEKHNRYVSVSGAPILDEKGNIVAAVNVSRDITEIKQAEQFREEYIHTISHDLRTPLTIIQGHAQLLQQALDKAGLSYFARRSSEAIVTSTRQMNAMIQDLVDSARLEAGQLVMEKQPVDVRAFVSELLNRAAGAMDVARVELDALEDLPQVSADPDRLERILMNLLTNALKYSREGNRVTIRIRASGDEVVISMTDRGEGISPEDKKHIFERFYRAKGQRKAEGLGLGLYITRMLVEAHGGRIWAESKLGKGSTFYFSLPL